ncbi:hypothetical protein [Castellaniella sp.]|uniref:hypothetical protein n=1 Tax=Castellaniella sp. TaxID=1955812 RepID=UPI002AFF0136|nr:hypothetical protein [Castellaniella sp.]
MTSHSPVTAVSLEKDGAVHALATVCAQVMREVAVSATPERFIHLVAQQVAANDGQVTAERVVERLQATAAAGKALAAELHWAGREGRA